MADLRRILASMRDTAAQAGVQIVTGDTKVVQRGSADKIFIERGLHHGARLRQEERHERNRENYRRRDDAQ